MCGGGVSLRAKDEQLLREEAKRILRVSCVVMPMWEDASVPAMEIEPLRG